MPQAYSVTFPAAAATAICLGQTTAGAAALLINGASLYAPDTMVGIRRAFAQLQSANLNVPPTPVVPLPQQTVTGYAPYNVPNPVPQKTPTPIEESC